MYLTFTNTTSRNTYVGGQSHFLSAFPSSTPEKLPNKWTHQMRADICLSKFTTVKKQFSFYKACVHNGTLVVVWF